MRVGELYEETILVSHSNDHFMLGIREARELRDQLTVALRDRQDLEFPEEDG